AAPPGGGTGPYRLLAGRLGDDLLRHTRRDLGVVGEDHRVVGPALRLRPEVADVAEHFRQRHAGLHEAGARPLLHRVDLAAAGVDVADDVPHVVLGGRDLDDHKRLEDHRLAPGSGLLEGHRAGDLERHLGRVDLVVGTVDEGRLDVDHRVAGQDAVLHGVLDARVHGGDVLLGHAAAGDLVVELVGLALLDGLLVQGLESDLHLRELTGTTGLLLVGVVELVDGALDGLAVGDLRLADIRLDLELTLHPVDEDVEVELAHAADDGLTGLLVQTHGEGR